MGVVLHLGYADDDVMLRSSGAFRTEICAAKLRGEVELRNVSSRCIRGPLGPFWPERGRGLRHAVRIARAAAGKDLVAFCGYHGWHDWYLAANLADASNLDGQLLPGLRPAGVPRYLRGSSVPFQFNDLASLERIVADVGRTRVIIMETERGSKPPRLPRGRAGDRGKYRAVLIFDEVTSGSSQ